VRFRRVGAKAATHAAAQAEMRLTEELTAAERSRGPKALTERSPEDLEECVAGCYWRWMVHTLLEDVATMKKNVDEMQDDLHVREEERHKLQQANDHHLRLQRELVSIEGDMRDFNVQVPKLRELNKQLSDELSSLIAVQNDLQERKRYTKEQIEAFTRRSRAADGKVYELDRKVQVGRGAEQDLQKKLQASKDDVSRMTADLKEAEEERDALAKQVRDLEAAYKRKKKKKGGKKK